MNASCASGSSQPIEAFGRQALLVEGRVEVDRLDALGRVQRGLPAVAVLRGDLAARLPDGRQVVVLGEAVERDGVDPAALRLDRLRGGLELVPRLRAARRRPSRGRPCGRSARGRRRTTACPRPRRRASRRRPARRRSRPSRPRATASKAPWSANSGVQVVPISATSGTLPPAIAVVNLSCAWAHGTNSMFTFVPGCFGLEVRRVALEDLLQLRRARIHDPGRDLAFDPALRGGVPAALLVVAAASGEREHPGERAGGQPPRPLHRNLLRIPTRSGWDD